MFGSQCLFEILQSLFTFKNSDNVVKVDVSKNFCDGEHQIFFEMKEGYKLSFVKRYFAKLLGQFIIFDPWKVPWNWKAFSWNSFVISPSFFYHLIRRDNGLLANEAFSSDPIVSSKQWLNCLKITIWGDWFLFEILHTLSTLKISENVVKSGCF